MTELCLGDPWIGQLKIGRLETFVLREVLHLASA